MQKAQSADVSTVIAWVTLRFSEEPSRFELLQNESLLWRESPAAGVEFEKSFPVSIDKFGAELTLRASLPGSGVIQITVEPDEHLERSQTLWVEGEVDETLTFTWSRDA